MDLNRKEFDYFKKQISEDKREQEHCLKDYVKPDEIINMYEGRIGDEGNYGKVWENHLSIAADTVTPNLFYQVPRPVIRPMLSNYSYSASVIDGLCRHYFSDEAKEQNQLCILDAFLPYGFGVMKVGYNSRVGYVKASGLLTGKSGKEDKKGIEENCEYIRYERPVISRVSPKDTFLDYSKPFGKGKHITFQHKRNLRELKESNLYKLDNNFLNYFKGRNEDETEIKFDLFEHWRIQTDGVYKLTYVNEWEEPLFWDKTEYRDLPVELLRFKKAPDRVYTIPHGRLAYEAQKELNYLNDLWKQHVDKVRRQHLIDMTGLDENGQKAIKRNDIDSIISCNRPPASVYAQISSNPMGKDVYANIDSLRGYLKLLLTISGGRAGEADADFATTEQAQAQGDVMRQSGMQDAIRDFVRGQLRKMVSNIVRFGNPELTIKITGKNVIDPKTGEMITGRELQFGGMNGLILREEIQGDIETDYLYDVDIASAMRPDFAVVRKQMTELITLTTNPLIEQKLLEEGIKIETSEMIKDLANAFDTVANPEKYFSDLQPEEKAALIQKQAMMAMGGLPPQAPGVPNETAIKNGANLIKV